jgi:hypothetical protein
MTQQTEAIELAYGLLWVVGSGRSTNAGEALYQARKTLLAQIDKAGQARGIIAANTLLGREDIGGSIFPAEALGVSHAYLADTASSGGVDMGRPACGQGDEWGRHPTDQHYGEPKS